MTNQTPQSHLTPRALVGDPPRRLLVSIHDVSPRHEGEIDRLRDLLLAAGADRIAMLVVPNFWGNAPIVPGSRFATRLRRWSDEGVEMFLHGSLHLDEVRHGSPFARFKARHMTAGEGEFLGLEVEEASSRIVAGRDLIESVTGRGIAGFVAPAWLYGPGSMAALERTGMALAEDHWKVWQPLGGRVLARSPVITWASRTPVRQASSLAVAALARLLPTPRVMRVGVHPGDATVASITRSISATVQSLRRRHAVSRYADLVGDTACAS